MRRPVFYARSSMQKHNTAKTQPFLSPAKTTDLGEKLDGLDGVFGPDEFSQPAVITGKGSVFGRWYVGRF